MNLLLSNNPSPHLNKQNKDSKTALEVAIDDHHSAIAMALIRKGAHLPFKHTSSMDIQFLQKLCVVGDVGLVKCISNDENEGEGLPNEKMEINEQLLNVVIRAHNIALLQILLASAKLYAKNEIL